MTHPRRGEIWLVDWSPGRGSEQEGVRPALVLQNDTGNKYSPTTIVAAISTNTPHSYPFHVPLKPAESSLPEVSIVKTEQIMTISKERLVKKAGQITPSKIPEVEAAIHISLGIKI